MWLEPVAGLGYAILAPYGRDAVSDRVSNGYECLYGLWREGECFRTNDGLVKSQVYGWKLGKALTNGVSNCVDFIRWYPVGKANALHGEVEPAERDEVQARDVPERLLVGGQV